MTPLRLLSTTFLATCAVAAACGGDADPADPNVGPAAPAGGGSPTAPTTTAGGKGGGSSSTSATGGSFSGNPTTLPRTDMSSLAFAGAFRLDGGSFGVSSVNYAVGTIALNPDNDSLFIAGHAQHNAVAEFPLVAPSMDPEVGALPVSSPPLQPFVALLDAPTNGNPDDLDRVVGMYVQDGQLIVHAEEWYDADGGNTDTTLVVRDADALDGEVDGYFRLAGAAKAAGYTSPVPDAWQATLGAPTITGWASNYSIISRYSVGPSLFTFDPAPLTGSDSGSGGDVATTAWMVFPHGGGSFVAEDALVAEEGGASPVWNFLSNAMFAFIVPGTRTFMVLGSSGGVESGIGYKITQDDGNLCGGYCAYSADDHYNYYWLFDLAEIVDAEAPHEPRPYDYGELSVPFDDGGAHPIVGGAFDPVASRLYLTLANAGQVGEYDRPPLVVVYDVDP